MGIDPNNSTLVKVYLVGVMTIFLGKAHDYCHLSFGNAPELLDGLETSFTTSPSMHDQ